MFPFLFVLCFAAISALECTGKNSYVLTDSVQIDGMYVHKNGFKFPPLYVFEKEIGGVNTTFGCDCRSQLCFTKCCPLGFVRNLRDCVRTATPEMDRIGNGELSLNFINNYKKQLDVKKVNLVYGIECEQGVFREEAKWYLQEDGKLFVEAPGTITQWAKKDPDEYCIDSFIYPDPETGQNVTKIDALVCFAKDADDNHDYTISFTCMLISCVFFIVTIAVYAWLPELHNLHGRVLMVYLSCMCVGFAFLAAMQILITINNTTLTLCIGLTFAIYFSLLSAFFWLNVMCFDIWWTFSGKRGLSLEKLSMRARFGAYAAYAFGFPTALTILLAALEFSGLPSHPAMPMLRQQGCFLYGWSRLLYLYGPMVILCIANLVFFILTAWKITQIKQQTQKTLKSKDSSTTDHHRSDKQRLLLYIKLFTIMGINWILEVISALYPQANDVWRFIDTYNVMMGVFIFIIFVCKRKIFRLMKKRYHQMRGHPMSRTQTQTTSTRTLSTRDDVRMHSIKNDQN